MDNLFGVYSVLVYQVYANHSQSRLKVEILRQTNPFAFVFRFPVVEFLN